MDGKQRNLLLDFTDDMSAGKKTKKTCMKQLIIHLWNHLLSLLLQRESDKSCAMAITG